MVVGSFDCVGGVILLASKRMCSEDECGLCGVIVAGVG